MVERRKLKRNKLIYYLRVVNLDGGDVQGHLVNINREGLMLVSEDPVETEQSYRLRIFLPDPIDGSEELVSEATSVWCRKESNSNLFATGFRMEGVTPHETGIIGQLVREYGFRH